MNGVCGYHTQEVAVTFYHLHIQHSASADVGHFSDRRFGFVLIQLFITRYMESEGYGSGLAVTGGFYRYTHFLPPDDGEGHSGGIPNLR